MKETVIKLKKTLDEIQEKESLLSPARLELNAKIVALQEEFTEKNRITLDTIDVLKETESDLRELVKKYAAEEFVLTDNKKLFGGISIRVSPKLRYESSDALKWARTNMPIIIEESVNKKTFEKYAKDNELEFVEKEDNVTVCFPKKIVLEEE